MSIEKDCDTCKYRSEVALEPHCMRCEQVYVSEWSNHSCVYCKKRQPKSYETKFVNWEPIEEGEA